MIDKPLNTLNRNELKDYIFKLQRFIKEEQERIEKEKARNRR